MFKLFHRNKEISSSLPAKPEDVSTPTWQKVAAGISTVALTACAPTTANTAPVPEKTITVTAEASQSSGSIEPITPDTTTYAIPAQETPADVAPSSEATSSAVSNETVATSTSPETADTLPTVEVPTFLASDYDTSSPEGQASLVRDMIEQGFQQWVNAGANEATMQTVRDQVARGTDLDTVLAGIAQKNRDAFTAGLFGDNYPSGTNLVEIADELQQFNQQVLKKYYETASDGAGYIMIITGVSEQALPTSTSDTVIASGTIIYSDNANDTSHPSNPLSETHYVTTTAKAASNGTYRMSAYAPAVG